MKDASIQLACGQPGAQEGDWAGYVGFCANPQECGCSQQQSRKAGPGSTLQSFPLGWLYAVSAPNESSG